MVKFNKTKVHILARKVIVFVLAATFILTLCSCSANKGDFDGIRFAKTRKITVMTDLPSDSLTGYIHDRVLADCNIDIVFVSSGYFIMDYGIVPDVAYTGNANKITTYYRMNSVLNMAPYLDEYDQDLTSLKDSLGNENIYYCTDDPSEVWYLNAKKTEPDSQITFIRADWLDALNLDVPSTRDELHECLIAFRDNADLLLGEDASELIPFFIDNEPNISCKPLFDSFYDPSISDKDFYEHGYCRATQPEYKDGLKTLNEWYYQNLLPEDYQLIRPNTKESYEPIENGYVGAFCARYDYLYKNGDNSHINALRNNRGDDVRYIAVNTFENSEGEYTCWQEDYLEDANRYIFFPSTCSDPLACLVYLNWLSETSNIEDLKSKAQDQSSLRAFLLTYQGDIVNEDESKECMIARQTAETVTLIQRGNKCVRYEPSVFQYLSSGAKLAEIYPDSTSKFVCNAISVSEDDFETEYNDLYNQYLESGSNALYSVRVYEWDKVKVKKNMLPL